MVRLRDRRHRGDIAAPTESVTPSRAMSASNLHEVRDDQVAESCARRLGVKLHSEKRALDVLQSHQIAFDVPRDCT
jgi:hypothetical protein